MEGKPTGLEDDLCYVYEGNTLLREVYDVTAGHGAAPGRWSAGAPGYTFGRQESWTGGYQEHCNTQTHCADLEHGRGNCTELHLRPCLNSARLDHAVNEEHSTQFRIPDSQEVLRGAGGGRCISETLSSAPQMPAGGCEV